MANRSIGNIQQLAEGKYLLRFSAGFDDFGKRIQVSKTVRCTNEKEAERLLMEFYKEREKCRDDRITAKPQTLAQLYDEWMRNHVEKQLKPRTKEYYANLWKWYLQDKGEIKLKSITPRHIYKMLEDVKGKRMTTECARQGVYKTLRAILSKGVLWGYLPSNPCDRVTPPKYRPKEKEVYNQETLFRMFELLAHEELKYQAIVYFAVLCGLRKQEIVGLKWEDIDFTANCFCVQRAATRIVGMGTIASETKNQSSVRKIALPSVLSVTLRKYYKEQTENRLKAGNKWRDEGWVFTQWDGAIMDIDTPSQWWAKFIARNDLPHTTFHCLRHTAATYLIKSGVDVSTVSGILGHAQKSTTLNIYSHVIEDAKEQAIHALESAIVPNNRASGQQ